MRLGFAVEWHRYAMAHSVCAEEVRDLGDWLSQTVRGRMNEPSRAAEPWLPDLCRLPRLATMFGVAELVVLILALAPDGGAHWNLQRFVSASGFALWLALTIAVALCSLRRQLSRLPVLAGALTAVAGAALIALLGAAMLHELDRSLGYGLIPAKVGVAQFASGSAAIAALITASCCATCSRSTAGRRRCAPARAPRPMRCRRGSSRISSSTA